MTKGDKKHHFFNNTKKRYVFIFAMLLLQTFVCLMTFEWTIRENISDVFAWIAEYPLYALYNVGFIFFILWTLYVFFNDLRISYAIWQCVMIIFGVAESLKFSERKEYIEFSDLLIAGEWAETISDIELQNMTSILVSVLLFAVLIAFFWYTKPFWKKKRTKKRMAAAFVSLTCCWLLFLCCVYYPAVKDGLANRVVFGAQGEIKGGIVCFAESISYNYMSSAGTGDIYEAVLDYFDTSGDETDTVLATDDTVDDIEVMPNIIVLMSEALWDINQLSPAVTFSENPMEAFYEIGGNFVEGKAASNVFGGGTDKSEFEFLTGWNSRYLVNGSSPYRDFFTQGQASLVQYLNTLGYVSYAIHPYKSTFWGRDTAYENMGFSAFYSMETMKYQDKYDVFISDASLTNEIIYRYEECRSKNDAPVFSFNVSIGNHVTKIADGEAAPISHDISVRYNIDYTNISAYNRKKLEEYVNGVYLSGQALKELITYFSEVDEPTVILVFGDHAPSFLSDFENYVDEDTATEGFYETPFYVWNNYDLGKFGEDEVNISYLSELLLEYIDFPLPKQAILNKYLRLYCPVDTRFIVKDVSGDSVNVTDSDYISRSLGMSNAMHNALSQNSYEMDIWQILPN